MHWTASPEKDTTPATLEKRVWDAADQFRAHGGLKPQDYSGPILGLIFLRFAAVHLNAPRLRRAAAAASARRGSDLTSCPNGRANPRGRQA